MKRGGQGTHDDMTHFLRRFSLLLVPGLLAGCTTFGDVQERFAVCSYDHAWDAALDAVKDRAVTKKDKEDGLIETGWLGFPCPAAPLAHFNERWAKAKTALDSS